VLISNALGQASSSDALLNVQVIGIALSSQNLLVGGGSNLFINASVAGTQPIILQWFKDGQPIAGATNATWTNPDASFFDAGQYLLVASNSFGAVTSAPVNVLPNLGGLLAYEGFNYSPAQGDIQGMNGGFGWASAWVGLDGSPAQINSNSLPAGTNAPSGFDARSVGGSLSQPNATRKGRYLDSSDTGNFALHGFIDSNGNIGADGKTLYLSFLQRPSDVVQFYECEIHRSDLGDGGRLAGIGNDTLDHDVHLRVEVPPGGSSTFWDLGAGSTNVNFYVMRIDFKPGNDDIFIYRNPVSASEPLTPTLTLSNIADMSFNGISFGAYLNNVSVSHDELRLGMTWSDVVGNWVSQLQLAQHADNVSRIRLAGSSNYSVQLAGASNVVGGWTNFATVVIPPSGIADATETNSDLKRFYRVAGGAPLSAPITGDVLISDFEGTNYGTWTTTGTAFGLGPAQGTLPGQQTVSGYEGTGVANSFNGGDNSVGILTSPTFVITKPFLNFLIGGGNHSGTECLNLVVSNVVVATATGANSEMLSPQQWNVSAYLGQTAQLQIVDQAAGSWGHILVDQIVASDIAFPSLSRQMVLTNPLLNLPVKNGSTMRRVTVTVGGKPVRDFKIPLADRTPDWWAFVNVSDFLGQSATISVDNLSSGSTGLSAIIQTNDIVGATNLYRETLRPQIHFSSKRGWLNDANGMIYYGGQYHLYYQHDPFNWTGNDQKYWGHAVSTDMVNWQELPEAIYPHSFGDWVWSGSAVVDSANTSGLKTGTNDLIVAAFTSTARGQCIAYSNDGGLSFNDYVGNPVVVNNGRDPHLLWYAPSNYWVMAAYDETGSGGIAFYSSPNLKQWTYRSKINGFFECPDLFPLPVDGNTNNVQWVIYDGSSGYMVGQFDGATFSPLTPKLPGNFGSGFYAAQTFSTMPPGDKRKVRIGWAILPMPGMPYNQAMFFPTTLTLQTLSAGVRLCAQPIAEMINNFVNTYYWTNLTLNPGYNPVSGIRGETFDLKAEFVPQSAQSIQFVLGGVTITYSPATQQIQCNGISQPLPIVNGSVQLEVIQDRQMLEIFGNAGQLYMPIAGTSYSPTNNGMAVLSAGNTTTFKSLTINKMKSIWSGKVN
jgi:fructan beta-fructosidase